MKKIEHLVKELNDELKVAEPGVESTMFFCFSSLVESLGNIHKSLELIHEELLMKRMGE